MLVERVGLCVQRVVECRQPRRPGVPVGNAVGRRVGDVEIAGRLGRSPEHVVVDELEFLGEAEHGPGQPAGPRGERGVALLGARAAELTVVHIEQRLVGRAAAHVVGVPPVAVEDVVARGVRRVLDQPVEQRDGLVVLAHEDVAEPVGHRERAAGPDGVDEERMRPVERVDVAGAVGRFLPAGRLHRAAHLQGQLGELPQPVVDAALEHEPAQRAVGAHVVEAVIVHAGVAHVRGHPLDGAVAAEVEEPLVAGRVELQQRRAVAEPLGPLGPPAGGVAPVDGEHRGRAVVVALDRLDFPG